MIAQPNDPAPAWTVIRLARLPLGRLPLSPGAVGPRIGAAFPGFRAGLARLFPSSLWLSLRAISISGLAAGLDLCGALLAVGSNEVRHFQEGDVLADEG
ncbi:MAG: hypothetical protein V3T93_07670, partial [Alphaproteobacteria bacterium]